MTDLFATREAREVIMRSTRRIADGAKPNTVAEDVMTELENGPRDVWVAFVANTLDLIAEGLIRAPARRKGEPHR